MVQAAHRLPRRAALALAWLSALAPCAAAQQWVPVGPPGGDVRSLAVDPRRPSVVYLGTATGTLYRSEDGGARWRRLAPGFPLPGMSLDDLVVDARGELVVGYWQVEGRGGGVARSRDGGASFELMPGISGQVVKALAVAPSNPDVLVAGSLGGVFRSRDGGLTWDRISPAGDSELRNVNSVAIDPRDTEVIYAGTWHLPWKTTDGGASWKRVHVGMIDDSDVMTLSFDRRDPERVFATACSGIYRSANAAGSWAKVRGIPGSSRRTRAFLQDPLRPETFYAGTTEGLWLSEDGAASWRLVTPQRLVVNALAALPGGVVLAGTDGAGVLRSADHGRTWSEANAGFSERFVAQVAFDAAAGRVLAGVHGDRHWSGVLAAPAPHGPWSRWAEGLEGRKVLAVLPVAGGALVGTDDGVHRSPAPGLPWQRVPLLGPQGLDLHPRVTGLAAAGNGVLLAASSKGVLRSADAGATWSAQTLGLAASVAAVAVAPDGRTAVAVTALELFGSSDAGARWEPLGAVPGRAEIHALAFGATAEAVFALTGRGLLRSRDGGRHWGPAGAGLPASGLAGMALDASGRTLVVSDFRSGGLYRSSDGGETWAPLPTAGLASERVWAVAVDPAAPERLLAAPARGGLHLLTVGGTETGVAGSR